jgi:hypothetical protein
LGRDIVRHNATRETTPTPGQFRSIAALVGGATVTAAAESAGVSRATVHRWLAGDSTFAAELALAKIEQAAALQAGIRGLGDLAVRAMQDLLSSPIVPPAVRLRAATTVLELLSALPSPRDLYGDDLRTFADVERNKLRAARIARLGEELARAEAERIRLGRGPDLNPDPDPGDAGDRQDSARFLAESAPEH